MRDIGFIISNKNLRKLYATFIIVILLTTLNIQQLSALQTSNSLLNIDKDYDGYIIKFKEESLSVFAHKFKNRMNIFLLPIADYFTDKILASKVKEYKEKILFTHTKAKNDILELIGNDYDSKDIISREFTNLFNGMTIKKISTSVLEKIKLLSYIDKIYPNHKIKTCLDDSIPIINADDVWKLRDSFNKNITGKNVIIAILDTGVDYNHPDLINNYIGGYDFLNLDFDPMDDHIRGHGTHVAGIAVGNGNSSDQTYVGVAPDAKFLAYKILNKTGYGNQSTFLAGIDRAMDPDENGDFSDHVDIISISAGAKNGHPNDPLSQAVDNAFDIGVVVTAAAGNEGPDIETIVSPGCARKSICVGATDKNNNIYYQSSRGPTQIGTVKPDVLAPGVSIKSTSLGGGYSDLTGTSMSTPHVAGAAALIIQANPDWTPSEVKSALMDSAVDVGYDKNTQGSGRIDVLSAIDIEDDDEGLLIDYPCEIAEGKIFTVSITNNDTPVKMCVLFTTPLHLPKFKYGSSVTFIAPLVFRRRSENLTARITVFKISNKFKYSGYITIINTRFSKN